MRKTTLQIHLDPPLMEWLRGEAKRRGVSMGEVVRVALSAARDAGKKGARR